eukprot:TRINITY_DN12962_c0_g1_i1.p1 TRINITY_DN12962_c0_g1~~TRINITY_DN12962_c0_g1_i1.p1  ORF type:complete len:420 (-),score=82.41 TRINITY_DN12962_c0_g1_i1:104-1330(-)
MQNPKIIERLCELYPTTSRERIESILNKYTDNILQAVISDLDLEKPAPVLGVLNGSGDFDEDSTEQLRKIDWASVKSFKSSESGSVGVYIINIKDKTVVVKGSKSPNSELFAVSLARHVNLSAPDTRVVARETDEMIAISTSLQLIAKDKGLDPKAIEKKLNSFPFLLIMQFVEGVSLGDLSLEEALKIFSGTDIATRKRFRDIGKLIALDMSVNNWDRLPFAWDNEGNTFNVMIQTKSEKHPGKVVGIDFGMTCIIPTISNKPNPNYEAYFKRISDLIKSLLHNSRPAYLTEGFARLKLSFFKSVEYDLTPQNIVDLRIGILDGIVRLASVPSDVLESLRENLPVPEKYSVAQWKLGSSDISLEFVGKVLNIFRENKDEASALIEKLKSLSDAEISPVVSSKQCLIC